MISVAKDWNPKQALLKEIIKNLDKFNDAIDLILKMHSMVHTSEMTGVCNNTYEDSLWEDLNEKVFRAMLTEKDMTIAWNIWHLTRIEDLTSNILIFDDIQVINSDNWIDKMNVSICDTGNTMSFCEVRDFSERINMNALRNYRVAVGRKTQQIIKHLKPSDMKRKVRADNLERIFKEGGVLQASRGLLDFWGRKDIAGILQMPITRHQIVHLNDALSIKEKLRKRL